MADNWYSSKPSYTFSNIVSNPSSIPSDWGMDPYNYGGTSNFKSSGTISVFGNNFTNYKFQGSILYNLKGIYIYKDSNNSVFNTKTRYSIKKPTGSSTFATFELKGIIKLGDYFYQIYIEIDQTALWAVSENKVNPNKSIYQPYEPVSLWGIGITIVKKEQIFSSASYGTETIISRTTYSNWEDICAHADSYNGIPNIGYYSEEDAGTTRTILAKFSGTSFTWSLTIENFETEKYLIAENATNYNVYVGKEVNQEFLNHFSLVYVRSNNYKTITTTIESSITKSGLSKTKWSYTDTNVAFNYSYNNVVVGFSSEKRIIQLADEKVRYNLITIKSSYNQGEKFDSTTINIKQSGSLLYSDGTIISLNEIDYISNPTITTSLEDDPIILDESILGFSVTYTLPTLHFGILTYEFYADVEGQTDDYITDGQNIENLIKTDYALLAQLDRALVYGTKGWGFELLTAHQKRLKSVDFDRFLYVF